MNTLWTHHKNIRNTSWTHKEHIMNTINRSQYHTLSLPSLIHLYNLDTPWTNVEHIYLNIISYFPCLYWTFRKMRKNTKYCIKTTITKYMTSSRCACYLCWLSNRNIKTPEHYLDKTVKSLNNYAVLPLPWFKLQYKTLFHISESIKSKFFKSKTHRWHLYMKYDIMK